MRVCDSDRICEGYGGKNPTNKAGKEQEVEEEKFCLGFYCLQTKVDFYC